jgi:hypothetical protein
VGRPGFVYHVTPMSIEQCQAVARRRAILAVRMASIAAWISS